MTLITDTARARAKLSKMLNNGREWADAGALPPTPSAFLPPAKRADIELALTVIDQLAKESDRLAEENARLKHMPAWVNGDPAAMQAEAQP